MSADLAPNILVIRRRYLGDIVLLAPFLRNLRLHWPNARITLLVEERFAEILSLNADLDEVLPHVTHGIGNLVTLWFRLRRSRFTHVFDLDCNDRSALFTWLTGASLRSRLELHDRLAWIYTHRLRLGRERYLSGHTSEGYLALLAFLGIPVVSREFTLTPKNADLEYARTLHKELIGESERTLLVHPGSRSAFRLWPADRFAAVIDRVQNELGARVVIIAGVAERLFLAEIQSHLQTKPGVVSAQLSLPQLASVMKICDVTLCHDSGPMHISAAVGTPVVALFGSQSTTLWRPLGEGHLLLQAPQPCLDCVAPEVCVPQDSYRNYCVRRLTTEEVFSAVRSQLVRVTAASE